MPLTVGGGIRGFTDTSGHAYSALDVAAEYFRSGADKVSIGSDAVYAAEEYLASGRQRTGQTAIEQISWVGASLPLSMGLFIWHCSSRAFAPAIGHLPFLEKALFTRAFFPAIGPLSFPEKGKLHHVPSQ